MVQRVVGLIGVFMLCVAFDAHADTPIEANGLDARLDGVWVLQSMERGGKKIENDDMPERMRGTKRTVNGNQMTIARGGGTRQLKCTMTVDTSTSPQQMDLSMERNGEALVLRCIYEIKNGVLKIAENNQERPKTFTTDRSSTRTLVSSYARPSE